MIEEATDLKLCWKQTFHYEKAIKWKKDSDINTIIEALNISNLLASMNFLALAKYASLRLKKHQLYSIVNNILMTVVDYWLFWQWHCSVRNNIKVIVVSIISNGFFFGIIKNMVLLHRNISSNLIIIFVWMKNKQIIHFFSISRYISTHV